MSGAGAPPEFLLPPPGWPAPARVQACCTARGGGVSAPPWASFNLATHVGDAPAAVAENRARLRAALSLPREPLWLQQVHGNAVYVARTEVADGDAPPVADAAVTRVGGLPLAIMVADCLPVLLAAGDGAVIGAAHAGWRGLAAGVIENTLAAMDCDNDQLHAWLGPCIRQANFEVGAEVRDAFVAASAPADRDATRAAFVANARGRWQCDLPALARLRLQRLGVRSISDCGLCTHADLARCFSHRRDGQTGRMAALLWLRA